MSESRLGRYLKSIAVDGTITLDPFNEAFFDRREYEANRLAEESAVIAEAMVKARLKGEQLERERNTAGNRPLSGREWK